MRVSNLLIVLLALAAAPACAAPNAQTGEKAAAQAASAERSRLEALLRGYHGLPERSRFEEAAAEPAKILRVIAADAMAGPMRAAALEALKWWPDDRTFALYTAAIAADQPDGVRHKALRYLVVFGDRALPPLVSALQDPDVQIRRTAATALFDVPGEAAGKALGDAARGESDPTLRATLEDFAARRSSVR